MMFCENEKSNNGDVDEKKWRSNKVSLDVFIFYSFYNITGTQGKGLIGRKIRIFLKDKSKNKFKFQTKQSQEHYKARIATLWFERTQYFIGIILIFFNL